MGIERSTEVVQRYQFQRNMWMHIYSYIFCALITVNMVYPSVMVMKSTGDTGRVELRGDLQCTSNRVVVVYLHGPSNLKRIFSGETIKRSEFSMDFMAMPSSSSGSLTDIDRLMEYFLTGRPKMENIAY